MTAEIDDVFIGAKFGRWTVVGERDRKTHNARVLCECECGKRKRVLIALLRGRVGDGRRGGRKGASRGCIDCLRKRQQAATAVGTRFGTWTIIEPRVGKYALCQCDCGHIAKKKLWQFRCWRRCHECARRKYAKYNGMTKSEIARKIGVSRERVRQLIARGETIEVILTGAYKKR